MHPCPPTLIFCQPFPDLMQQNVPFPCPPPTCKNSVTSDHFARPPPPTRFAVEVPGSSFLVLLLFQPFQFATTTFYSLVFSRLTPLVVASFPISFRWTIPASGNSAPRSYSPEVFILSRAFFSPPTAVNFKNPPWTPKPKLVDSFRS